MTDARGRVIEAMQGLADWRSLEVFGPPGAGKSFLCRHAGAALGALTMCDRQAVRFYAAIDFPLMTATAEKVLPRQRLRNYYSIRLSGYSRRYWRIPPAEVETYRAAVARVRDLFPIPESAQKRFANRVEGSAAMTARALADGHRIIVDEGLLNQLNSAVARSTGSEIDDLRRGAIRDVLEAYPWEKTAIVVEASVETCVRRQQEREHILFSAERPQQVFHAVTDTLDELCRETGWRIVWVNND